MTDYPSHTPEGDCIFCKIVSGEMSTPGVFWEDDEFMAFLSIFPSTDGFSVVIPKKHYHSDVLALPDDVLSRFVVAAKKVAAKLEKYFEDVGRVGLVAEGTGINHAHFKLVPMHGTPELKNGGWQQYHSDNDTFYETYPGYIASNDSALADEDAIRTLAEELKKIEV